MDNRIPLAFAAHERKSRESFLWRGWYDISLLAERAELAKEPLPT